MLDIVRKRRSVRRYEDRSIEPEKIEQLKEVALRAPTGNNKQAWHFTFVTDRNLLRELSTVKPRWADFLAAAPLGIVVSCDTDATDIWVEDASIAAAYLQLAATSLGLGSCWIQIRDRMHEDGRPSEEHIRELLGLPEQLRTVCMLAIGYPAEERPEKPREGLTWEAVEER
jgi:nitroreductase